MKKNPRRNETAEATAPARAVDGGVLELIEDVLVKMIVGLFRFISVKVPTEIYRAVVRWFPTLMRIGKIVALLAFWLTAALGPCLVTLQFAGALFESRPQLLPAPSLYLFHPGIWQVVVGIYTALALSGSVWGVLYVRRRRKLAKDSQSAR